MLPQEQWIWLDEKTYPKHQTTKVNGFQSNDDSYAVTEFVRRYEFEKKIVKAVLRFSGDTEFRLMCNESLVATGPVTIPGDFMCNDEVRPWHYATQVTIPVDAYTMVFYARVKLMPCGINEYSSGHGGWMLSGAVMFEDGTHETFATDESWLCRRDPRFIKQNYFDGTRLLPAFENACEST